MATQRSYFLAAKRASTWWARHHHTATDVAADEAVAKSGDALGHADHGKTSAAHHVGAAAIVPVLRVLAGGQQG